MSTDTSGEIRIQRDWKRSLALPAICLFLALASIYGMQIEPHSIYEHRSHSASFIMFPTFSVLFPFTLFRLFVPWGAPVRMSPAGFVDLRAGTRPIPGYEISNVVRRGEFVSLTLKRKFAKGYKLSFTQRALKATRKSAGPTHLLVAYWCLETTPVQLLEIVSMHWDKYSGKTPTQ